MPNEVVDDEQLTTYLARHAVREIAPQEMPLFRANAEAYFKDPQRALAGSRSGDDMLGFGGGVEVVLLTPVALAVAREVARFVLGEFAKVVAKEAVGQAREVVTSFLAGKSGGAASTPPPLTHAQLEAVHDVAYTAALRLLLPEDRARVLADSTVGALALA
jgi:hypothetical protein